MNFKQCNTFNFSAGRTKPIQYIVIHYTANDGDTAKNNIDYFANNRVGASAHYFVDEKEVWQSVKDADTAWHCGGGIQGSKGATFLNICMNSNSIGIELCSRKANGKFYFKDETMANAIGLTKQLMVKYNIPARNVIRHFDVTGKICPAPFVDDEMAWMSFKNKLTESEEIEMIYNYIDENMPGWARPTIQKLVDKGVLKGNEHGELGLNDTMLKLFVAHDRLGLYDK